MITLDALRSALLAEQPWSEMDRLVRAELASGRLTDQVSEELQGLVEEVRNTPGITEQAEGALGDTLDRLSGFCRADQAYKNSQVLPTKAEVLGLPRWARVAFAARCARRVLPLHRHFRPSPEHRLFLQDPEWAVDVAEKSAATGRPQTDSLTGYNEAASMVFEDENPADESAHNTTMAAAYAAADAGDDARPERAWFAMNYASAASTILTDQSKFVRRDMDQLLYLTHVNRWGDGSPVPPDVFGPLWPDGPPAGWPADPVASRHTDIPLEVVARDGFDERIVEDEVVNLFNAMNHFHIARGGAPLSLEDLQPLISALVPGGV